VSLQGKRRKRDGSPDGHGKDGAIHRGTELCTRLDLWLHREAESVSKLKLYQGPTYQLVSNRVAITAIQAIVERRGTSESESIDYDYENQAWVVDGKYIRCGHPDAMDCQCFGLEHQGEAPKSGSKVDVVARVRRGDARVTL
jgi:hypothetical protein